MAAAIYNIYIEQGASFLIEAQLTEDGTTPIDLTGYLGRGQIRTKASSEDIIAEFTVTVTDAEEGTVQISLTSAQTEAIEAPGDFYSRTTKMYYDIELYTANDADVIRLLNGQASISPEITKANA